MGFTGESQRLTFRVGETHWTSTATLPRVKVAAVLKLIEGDGWTLNRTRGSHRQYRHPTKPGLVTVPGKPRDDLQPKTLANILRQAGLKSHTGMTDQPPEGGQA
jgi:predicted RNA binding protein YcfA (HicA-like mRNA interferase family)